MRRPGQRAVEPIPSRSPIGHESREGTEHLEESPVVDGEGAPGDREDGNLVVRSEAGNLVVATLGGLQLDLAGRTTSLDQETATNLWFRASAPDPDVVGVIAVPEERDALDWPRWEHAAQLGLRNSRTHILLMETLDAPGTKWRFLAQEDEQPFEIIDRGQFDEFVLDDWLHIEKLDTHHWWIRLGDADINVEIGEDGRARVDVERGAHTEVNGTTSTNEPPDQPKAAHASE